MSDSGNQGSPWGPTDRRLLLITFVGGLASILAGIIVLGLAVALIHLMRHFLRGQGFVEEALLVAVSLLVMIGLLGIFLAIPPIMDLWPFKPDDWSPSRSRARWHAATWCALAVLATLEVLIWVGLAAGIK